MKGGESDLTKEEQQCVRAALQFLRTRFGGWDPVAKLLRTRTEHLSEVARRGVVTPTIAFRVARIAQVTVDDVLKGRFPAPGTCPYCGHTPDGSDVEGSAQ